MRELVIEHEANRSAKDNGGNDILMYAVRGGHNDLVRVLIKEFHFNANTSRSNQGRTPLHEARTHTQNIPMMIVALPTFTRSSLSVHWMTVPFSSGEAVEDRTDV